jgi:O-antigen/teichoic acid export membrane protein
MQKTKQEQASSQALFKRRIKSGGSWALGIRLSRMLVGLAVNALLARLLAPEDLGVYFLLFSFSTVAIIVALGGQGRTSVKFVAEALAAKKKSEVPKIYRCATLLVAGNALFVGACLLFGGPHMVAAWYEMPELAAVMGYTFPIIVLMSLTSVIAETFRGLHDIRLAAFFAEFAGLACFLMLLLAASLLYAGLGLSDILSIYILALGLTFILALKLLSKEVPVFSGRSLASPKKLLGVGAPIMAANLSIVLYSNIDIWLLGGMADAVDVALYGSAARLILVVLIPLHIMGAVVPPIISEMHHQGKTKELEQNLRKLCTLGAVPGVLVVLVFLLFGRNVLSLVFGPFYADAYPMLALLSLGQGINILCGSGSLVLMMTSHQQTIMKVNVLFVLFLFVACIVGIFTFGPVGLAGAAGATFALNGVTMTILAKRKVDVWTHFQPVYFLAKARQLLAGKIR